MDGSNENYEILRNLYTNVSFNPFLSWFTTCENDKPEIVKDSNSYDHQRRTSKEQPCMTLCANDDNHDSKCQQVDSENKIKSNSISNVSQVDESVNRNVDFVYRKRKSSNDLSRSTLSWANLQDMNNDSKSAKSLMVSSLKRSDSVSTLVDGGSVKRRRILIIDNATMESKFLSRLLQKRGHYCEEAANGKNCIDKVKTSLSSDTENIDVDDLRKKTYDVVLMNLQMAEPSGIETAQGMRDIGYTGAIIGVITCLPDEKDEFLQAGVTNIISKPYKLNQMNAIIDSL